MLRGNSAVAVREKTSSLAGHLFGHGDREMGKRAIFDLDGESTQQVCRRLGWQFFPLPDETKLQFGVRSALPSVLAFSARVPSFRKFHFL